MDSEHHTFELEKYVIVNLAKTLKTSEKNNFYYFWKFLSIWSISFYRVKRLISHTLYVKYFSIIGVAFSVRVICKIRHFVNLLLGSMNEIDHQNHTMEYAWMIYSRSSLPFYITL